MPQQRVETAWSVDKVIKRADFLKSDGWSFCCPYLPGTAVIGVTRK